MANSLRAKLSKLRHDGNITDAEYQELIKKLDGHDAEIYNRGYNQGTIDRAEEVTKAREQGYNKAIDEFAEKIALEISESVIWDMLATMSKNSSLSNTSDKIVDYVIDTAKKIAEQMKGGAE